MEEKTLYVTDLDGTLLNRESLVSEQSRGMLNEAVAKGALFSVATARTPATISGLLSGVDLRLPLVVMTGAALWDPVSDKYLHTHFHRESQVRELLEIYRRHELSVFIYTLREHKIHIYHQGSLSANERNFIEERSNSRYKSFHIPEDGNSELPEHLDNVLLLFAMQPTGRAAAAFEDIRRMPEINKVFYKDIFDPSVSFIEAFPPEATKAKGIARLTSHLGSDRTVVFGDNFNDLPMFRAATEGIAVGNAIPEVKAAATSVIGPNTEDSVAKEILRRTLDGIADKE